MRVESHVATCTACASLLEQYRGVVGALPLGLDPVPPPAEAWAAIRAEAARRRPRGPGPASIKGLPSWRRVMWPVVAALAASLLVWNVVLQLELTRRPPGPEVEALARRPGRLVILTGTGAPGASGRLLVAIDGHHGHLATAGLRPLPAERTYQLWFVRPGAPTVTMKHAWSQLRRSPLSGARRRPAVICWRRRAGDEFHAARSWTGAKITRRIIGP
ncbi:MAG: hypothetical protein DME10_23685 [Candidatus Rokuibacteriota bacterium]|nr:MAG: hypothetical protein DME10_23685 [Candidatus Rokubacteria bacterium]